MKNDQNIKALVLYQSLFGNTKLIAESISDGLRSDGIIVDCKEFNSIKANNLLNYDFIAIGAPTQQFGISSDMQLFLETLIKVDFEKTNFFCFDTRIKMIFNNPKFKKFENSASKKIESILLKQNLKILRMRESGLVEGKKGPLIIGSNEKFFKIGRELGDLLKDNTYETKILPN